MHALFLSGPGPQNLRLTKEGLQVGKEKPVPPPQFDYDTILIGNCKGFVSFPALKALGRWGITVGLMGRGGTPLSVFVPWKRNDAPLRLAQMKAAIDPKRCLTVSRALVEAKTGTKLPARLSTVAEVRKAEGDLAQRRWVALEIERRSGFYKTQNAKATTPVNCAINYAQGVLAVRCRTAISKVGLDESVGFLHAPTVDKSAFVYDVQELIRHDVDEVAIEFARDHPDSFVRDEDWVYRVGNLSAPLLACRVEGVLNRRVRFGTERVSREAWMVRELRRLGRWFLKPTSTFSFDCPIVRS